MFDDVGISFKPPTGKILTQQKSKKYLDFTFVTRIGTEETNFKAKFGYLFKQSRLLIA